MLRFFRMILVIFLYLDGSDNSIYRVGICIVMESFHRGEYRGQFLETFTFEFLTQGLILRHFREPDSAYGILEIHAGTAAYHRDKTSFENIGVCGSEIV